MIRTYRGSDGALRLVGELDSSSVDDVVWALDRLAEPAGDVVLDLSELQFMGSEGVWLFANLASHGRDRHVVLRNPSPAVLRVLAIAGADRLPAVRVEAGAAEPAAPPGPGRRNG